MVCCRFKPGMSKPTLIHAEIGSFRRKYRMLTSPLRWQLLILVLQKMLLQKHNNNDLNL